MKKVVIRVMSIILSCVVLVATFLVSASAGSEYVSLLSVSGVKQFSDFISASGDGFFVRDDGYSVSATIYDRLDVTPGYHKGNLVFTFPKSFSMEKGKTYKVSYVLHFEAPGTTYFTINTYLNSTRRVSSNSFSVNESKDITYTQNYVSGSTFSCSNLTLGIDFTGSSHSSNVSVSSINFNSVDIGFTWETGPVPDIGSEADKMDQAVSQQQQMQNEIMSQVKPDELHNALGDIDDVFSSDVLAGANLSSNLLDRFFTVVPEFRVLFMFAVIFGLALFIIGRSINDVSSENYHTRQREKRQKSKQRKGK